KKHSPEILIVAADDRFQEIAEEAVRLIKKIEPDVTVQTM
ncbi:hypothetical protein CLOSTHATH_07295, partial [Hungatella hathewayi DSM 13479]